MVSMLLLLLLLFWMSAVSPGSPDLHAGSEALGVWRDY